MELVVGCPVAHRNWILPRWFEHVDRGCKVAGVDVHFVFVVHRDDPSLAVLQEHAPGATIRSCEYAKPSDLRIWKDERYRQMVDLRNQLLGAVRELAPDAFLSLDSDILIAEPVIGMLLADLSLFDAVGAKCYMTTGSRIAPSWARITRENQLQRCDADGLFEVDVIMAAKMMSPAAYTIDYEWCMQGEDIGWCQAARRAGLRLGWDGRVTSKHVMNPTLLDAVDPRVGF